MGQLLKILSDFCQEMLMGRNEFFVKYDLIT